MEKRFVPGMSFQVPKLKDHTMFVRYAIHLDISIKNTKQCANLPVNGLEVIKSAIEFMDDRAKKFLHSVNTNANLEKTTISFSFRIWEVWLQSVFECFQYTIPPKAAEFYRWHTIFLSS